MRKMCVTLLLGLLVLFSSAVNASDYLYATYYGHGTRTANGERFDPNGFTAAHRTLPFNTRVNVTNLANNRSVIVRINDRGPFAPNRHIDLSIGAAREIGMIRSGVARVRMEVL